MIIEGGTSYVLCSDVRRGEGAAWLVGGAPVRSCIASRVKTAKTFLVCNNPHQSASICLCYSILRSLAIKCVLYETNNGKKEKIQGS